MAKKNTYRVTFHNQGKVFEIYARNVQQSSLFGFIQIEKIIFGEKTSLVVDPSEEHLKSEFAGVNSTFIPIHSVIRIDEVEKTGPAKISEGADNIATFPIYTPGQGTNKP